MSMQVRTGYKLTEAGVIPDEWCVATLGEICTFENGDRGSNYPSPNSFVASGVPFINAGHIAGGRIDFGKMNYITPESFNRLGSGKIRRGDILFCLRGSIGKFGIADDYLGDGAIASSLVIIRPNASSINLEYLGCYFGSELCSRMIETWSGGAAQPNLGAQDLAKFSIPIPAQQAEQRAIAATLSDMDALISGLDQLIAKKRDIKQASTQQLLTGQHRLPGFSGEWEVKRLGDICGMKSGEGITSSDIDAHSKYPCYGGNGLRGYTKTYTHDGAYVLIGRQGALCGNIVVTRERFFASEHAIVTTPSCSIDVTWLALVLCDMNLNQYSESSAQPGLSVAKLLMLLCSVPPLEEQIAITTILSDMNNEIVALETRRDKAQQLKQGMMQELLTGRIRLPNSVGHS